MEALLRSIGYDAWVLPALLIIPVVGAIALLGLGEAVKGNDASEESNRTARMVAFVVLMAEYIPVISLRFALGFITLSLTIASS